MEYTDSQDFVADDRVELHPALDLWMMGDRFGTVIRDARRPYKVQVKLDVSGRTIGFVRANLRKVR